MGRSAGYTLLPFKARKEDIVFPFFVVYSGKFSPKHGVGEAYLKADTAREGDVGVIEICRSPSKGPGVEGENEYSEAIRFGVPKQLQGGSYQSLKRQW